MSLVSWKKFCCATIQLCPLLGKTGFTFCYPLIMNTSMILASCFCFFFYQVNSSNSDNSFLCVAIRQHVLPYDESKLSFEVVLLYFNVLKSIFSLNISCTCIRDTDFPSPRLPLLNFPKWKVIELSNLPLPPPNLLLLHPSEISKASGARHLISAPCSCSSNNRSFPSWSRSQVFVPTSLIHCLLSKVSQVQLVMKVFLCKLRSTHALVIVDAMANVPQFMQICRNKFKRL